MLATITRPSPDEDPVLEAVRSIASDEQVRRSAERRKLAVQTVTWEDTGRWPGSVWGPNISDLTLHARGHDMPVIRSPNFQDVTVDMPIGKLFLIVGNESGAPLSKVPLEEYLKRAGEFTGNSRIGSLFAPRDASILASPQACILPLREGKVAFHPRIYNYQSSRSDPAVLVLLATSQGTSAQVVADQTDLYFNDKGTAVEFLAKRLQDDRKERGVAADAPMTAEEKDRNVLYLIQIPLKTKPRPQRMYMAMASAAGAPEKAQMRRMRSRSSRARGFDYATIEKGTESKGPFRGTEDLALVRDERFPIRITIQIYTVTDQAGVPDEVMQELAERLESVKKLGINEGSLVLDGKVGRPTEHDVNKPHCCAHCRRHFRDGFYVKHSWDKNGSGIYCSRECVGKYCEKYKPGSWSLEGGNNKSS